MRTSPPRRDDGKFGVGQGVPEDAADASTLEAKQKRTKRGTLEKGTAKVPGSGRKKGTPNKLSATVRARLDELGCDPVEGLAQIAMDENERSDLRARCFAELLPCVYPRMQHLTAELNDIEARNRRILEGQKRVAEDARRREAEEKKKQEGSANDATQTNTPT